jgi:UDPglucose 6-dehydrogenase
LPEVADYWEGVIKINDYQRKRFAQQIIESLFNTVNGKKISFLGWAFKKDTNDTRESAAIYVACELLLDNAEIHVYDPKVSEKQIRNDVSSLMHQYGRNKEDIEKYLTSLYVYNNACQALNNAHAIAVLTEWDEFINLNWHKIYKEMYKPAFIFDGRNILNSKELEKIGFKFKGIGK